jgi:hypothetical protein
MSSVEWVSGQPINDALFGRRIMWRDGSDGDCDLKVVGMDDDGCDSNSSGGPVVVVTVMV